jgi:hypothetical protein
MWEQHLRDTAAWLVVMSNTPGWLEHAKHRRDQLLASPMYGERFRTLLAEAMKERTDAKP